MKLIAGQKMKINSEPILSTELFSVIATQNESKLISGFKVTIKKGRKPKDIYVPVVRGNYMAAWLQVYRHLKPIL